MNCDEQPSIIFQIINDENILLKTFYIELEFLSGDKINLNQKFIIETKFFPKAKDKFKTNLILHVDNSTHKFTITLYYSENHVTIYKSTKIGVTYEIIQIFDNNTIKPLDSVDFISDNNKVISANFFDVIGNTFRRRYLLVNFPINVKLNINKRNKMKENSSYKINLLPNDIIIQECTKNKKNMKKQLNDINEINSIVNKIKDIVKKDRKNTDYDKMNKIINEMKQYDEYFNQNLLNKEDETWSKDEFILYYHYFLFKLFLNYACIDDNRKFEYYHSAMKIFEEVYGELEKISNVSIYEKICAIVSLYTRFKIDCENKENKGYLIADYKLINMNDNKIECYNLAYKFIKNIIEKLSENSFIFLPLLQVNSGYNKNINSDDEKEVFELSMTNVNMVKRHLNILLPNLFFTVRHPTITLKRGSTCKATGNMFIYETSIFNNKLGKSIEDILENQPEDAAVIISFVILHEIFMHKKIRANEDFTPGKETPSKFIGPKYEVKNFYYSNNKKNLDPLSIYNKNKEYENKIPNEGESGKILEYFLENKNFEIMNYLKKYLGFGELLNSVDLIVDKDLDKLHKYIINKIKDGKAKPLLKEKLKKNKESKYDYYEYDEEMIDKNKGEEEEEEEDSEESSELSEETKRCLSLQTD